MGLITEIRKVISDAVQAFRLDLGIETPYDLVPIVNAMEGARTGVPLPFLMIAV